MFSLLFAVISFVSYASCSFRFLLLHTNDMHSHFEEVKDPKSNSCYGGFARVRAAVDRFSKEAEANNIPTLYLDAGDVFQETTHYTEFKWKIAVKMMNLLRPKAMVLGNHEFDDGVEGLAPFVKKVKVPILGCNVDVAKEPKLQVPGQIKPSMVISLGKSPNIAKIGIVGYTTRVVSQKKLGNVKILDEIESLQKEVDRLRKEDKVNIVIALGHSGYDKDKEIAEKVNGIDVVVGAHTHTFLYNGDAPTDNTIAGEYPTMVTQQSGKKVPVVQASAGTKYLGCLELEFDSQWTLVDHKGLPVFLSADMEQDKQVLRKLKPEGRKIAKKYQTKIGSTEFNLGGKCKIEECNVGDMIADAFVDYVNSKYMKKNVKPVEIGLIHGGAIKGTLWGKTESHTGEIVLEDLMNLLPFGMSLEVLQLKGSVLRSILESSVNEYSKENKLWRANLMQVSGIKVDFDLTREKGHRLVSVKVGPKLNDLDDNVLYNVVMPDYIAQGNNYPILTNQKRPIRVNQKDKDYLVVAEYIKKIKTFNGKYEHPGGRLSFKT